MLGYILVMLGGALGTGARFWMSGFVAERGGEVFPLGTGREHEWFIRHWVLRSVYGSARFSCRRDFGNFSWSVCAAVTQPFHRSAYKHSILLVMEIG
jgi:hypothetical protein